jgi:large subunit ribosomal protein L17
MRHRKNRNRLKQKPGHARIIKRNLLTSLLLYERVRTTKRRALAIAPTVDRMITYAKKHSPQQAVRYLNRTVTDRNASRKVMEVFIARYKDRPSGLTRMKPAGARAGDGAELVDLELVDFDIAASSEQSRSQKPGARSQEKPETKNEKRETKPKKKSTASKAK